MIFRWLSFVVGIAYVVMGIFVIYYKNFIVPLEDPIAYGLGVLLIVYGAFRVARNFINQNKNSPNA